MDYGRRWKSMEASLICTVSSTGKALPMLREVLMRLARAVFSAKDSQRSSWLSLRFNRWLTS